MLRALSAPSLAWRIFYASIILMPLLLGFSAFMLDRAFRSSIMLAEKESLLAHTYSMMAVAEPDEGFLLLPNTLTDSRFNDPASGLYAQVVDDEYGPIWESISLTISPYSQKIPSRKIPMGQFDMDEAEILGEDFFISRINTLWEIDGQDREYQFVVVHTQDQFQQEINRYRATLSAWLGGLALLLILVQTIIIRWGLFPLKRLANDIKALESGKIGVLDKNYPDEILPVIQNINLLLDSEKKHRTRYHNTMADLAHSLKTPLSVIRSVIEKQQRVGNGLEGENTIDEQIERMSNIIGHQLNRASATKASFLNQARLLPLFQRLSTALQKVYQDKNLQIVIDVDSELEFPAQEGDLMEVFGNLLENACKYGKSQVAVSAQRQDKKLTICVEDDGAGVKEFRRIEILERGARADTSAPGQGIGLAVAVDILSAYGAGIQVQRSERLGGACFIVELTL